LASVQSRPGRAGNRRGLSTAAAALSVNTSCGSTDSDSKTLPTLAGEPTASSRRTDGQPRWKTRAECVGPRRINGQAFQGTFASICTVYGRRRTNSVDRHLPCPGRDASPAIRPRTAMGIQYQDAAHAASVLLVSDHLVEPLRGSRPPCRAQRGVESRWFLGLGRRVSRTWVLAAHQQPGMNRCIIAPRQMSFWHLRES
jgi:hypothetical protein